MQVCETFLRKEMADLLCDTVNVSRAYTYHVAWILGEKSWPWPWPCQGQDIHQVSSRILEAKTRPRGQQDCLTDDWSLASIRTSLTASTNFGASFWVRSFIQPDLFDHNVPLDNTTPIYLINLPWKLGLGLGLDLKLRIHGEYPSIFSRICNECLCLQLYR